MSEGAFGGLQELVLGRPDEQLRSAESILYPHVAPLRQYITERLVGTFNTDTQRRLGAIINELLINEAGYGELEGLILKREYFATHGGAESPNVLQEAQQGFNFLLDGMEDGLSVDVRNPLKGVDALKKIAEQRQGKADVPPFAQEMYGKGVIYGLVANGCADKEMYKVPLQLIGDAVGRTVDNMSIKEPRHKLQLWRLAMTDYTNKYGFGMFVDMRHPREVSHQIQYETVLAAEGAADDVVFGRRLLVDPESAYAQGLMIEIARQKLTERVESDPRRKYFRENLPEVLTRGRVWPDDMKSVPAADYLAWLFQNEEKQWANVDDVELFSQLASQLIVRNIKEGHVLEGNDPEKIGTRLRKIVWQVGYGLRKASLAAPLIQNQDLKDFAADDQGQIIEAYGLGRIAVGNIENGIATLKSLAKTRGQAGGDIVSELRPILGTIQENMQTGGTVLQRIVTTFNTEEQLSTFLATSPH